MTLPEEILERLSPTTLEADMFEIPDPSPKKEPVNDPVKLPFPDKAKDAESAQLAVP